MFETVSAYGLKFQIPPFDEGVGRCLRDHGEFARVELEFLLAACHGNFLDVGANIGAICLPFASRRPEVRVAAVEFNPKIAALLAQNAISNGIQNVEVVNAAAGERIGWIDLPIAPIDRKANIGATSIYDSGHPIARMPIRTIDTLAPENTRLVKIDVEGFEPRVLAGATRLLSDVRPSWLVEISRHRPDATSVVRDTFLRFGYRIYWFFSPFLSPKPGEKGDFRGDFAIFASDDAPPWPMATFSDEWPSGEKLLPYFAPPIFSQISGLMRER